MLILLLFAFLTHSIKFELPTSCSQQNPGAQCCTDLKSTYANQPQTCQVSQDGKVMGINLENLQLTGTIPAFTSLSNLDTVNLANNRLSGGFDGLESLTDLIYLKLNNNDLSSVDDAQFRGLTNLKSLELQYNNINDDMDDTAWLMLSNLETIDISSNAWNKGLPRSMVSLTNLKSFNASYNPNLFGKFRVDYESWGKLTSLDLSHCRFGGYLEDGYGDHWLDLEHLDISENNFGDVIPENWKKMTKLTHLNFARNVMQGSAPSWLGTAPGLQHLDVSSNALTGQIPDMNSLSSLTYIDFSNNKMSGTIPKLPAASPSCTLKMGGNLELSCPVKNYASSCPTNNDFVQSYSADGKDNCGNSPTPPAPNNNDNGKLGGGYVFLIVLCVLAILGGVGYLAWKYYETQQKYEFDYQEHGDGV